VERRPRRRRQLRRPRFSLFSREVLHLSIEGTTIRITASRGDAITGWLSVPIAPRYFRNGYIADSQNVGQAISSALREAGLRRGSVVYALPGFQTLTRVINLPQAARRNLDTVVEREARRLMPFSTENSHLFWQRLPPQRGQERVYAVTVPKEPLATLTDAMQRAGLRPRAVDLHPLALARGINRSDGIIVHGENNSFEVIIMVEGIPSLVRSTFLGEQPSDLESVASRLTDELARTIAYYNETNQDNPLDPALPIYITGELAAVSRAADEITAITGRSVAPLEAPLRCPPELPLPQFMVNLGLALKKL